MRSVALPIMSRRLLLVHAHPDDETIGTGVTMARYVAERAEVTLVTCTLGEEGEILVPDLVHLAADAQDELGLHRQGELADAMSRLGVTDHRLLGGPGRFRDSGMIGTPSNDRTDCFWRTDLLVAATELVSVIREVREEVGVEIDTPTYVSSQPWPFPHSLMLGFRANWLSGDIVCDPTEIMDAQWYRRDELPNIPPRISIARKLIDLWVAEG